MRRIILILIIVLSYCSSYAQENTETLKDSILHRFNYQLAIFPQEKIFTHTDKNYYISGEKIWFRSHLVNAANNIPDSPSRYIYAELINPLDSIITRVKIRPDDNGLFHGHIGLPEQLPEGDYIIRSYTRFMQNLDDAYLSRKIVRIGNPASSTIKKHIFIENNEKKIFFTDKNDNKIKPKKISIRYGRDRVRKLSLNSDSIGTLSTQLLKEESNTIIHIEFESNGSFYSEFINISLDSVIDDFDVSFFPEGGNLPEGALSNIAFKAIGSDGLSVDITGEIVDEEGNILMPIESVYLGMGTFGIIPQIDKSYFAICRKTSNSNISKKIEIPKATVNTYSVKAKWYNGKLLTSVSKSDDLSYQENLYILIHSGGIVQSFSLWDKNKAMISIDEKDLPSGIIQIVLLDSQLNTLSERLVFNTFNMSHDCKLVTNSKEYKPRQLVSSKFNLDNNINTLNGSFSVSVTNDTDVLPDTIHNILSYLLLSSEIKGHIESPEQYTSMNRDTQYKLDLLMLTQGWRRYNIPEVTQGEYSHPTLPLELGQEISGIVKTGFFKTKGTVDNEVSLFAPQTGYLDIVKTDKDGLFSFTGFEFPDSTSYFVQALSKKGRKSVELYINKEDYPAIKSLYTPFSKIENFNQETLFENYIAKSDKKYLLENGMRMIQLPEVKVSTIKRDKRTSIYSNSGQKLFSQSDIEKSTSIESLLSRIPHAKVTEDMKKNVLRIIFNNGGLSLFGKRYATIILDDVVMEDDYDIRMISLHDIEEISIMKRTETAILGSEGMGGAVVIRTKTGESFNSTVEQFNKQTITPLGFQMPIEFYSPKYETKEQINDSKPDLRTTVYWKPDIIIPEKGEASFDFYTADISEPTTYTILIQGLTSDGQIIYKTNKISVKQ